MKINLVKVISLLVAIIMILSALASCSKKNTGASESQGTEGNSSTEKQETSTNDESGSKETTGKTESGSESESESESDTVGGEIVGAENRYTELIKLSNSIKNGVNPYYSDGGRQDVTIENKLMTMGYHISGDSNKQITYFANKSGANYIENTMDVILRMSNGSNYYASKSLDNAILNIYRYGFYYYETRFEGQTFMNDIVVEEEHKFDLNNAEMYGLSNAVVKDGVLTYKTGTTGDPQFRFGDPKNANLNIDTSKYVYLEFTMKIADPARKCEIYIVSGESTGFSNNQRYQFDPVVSDDYVTYLIPLADVFTDYTKALKAIRFDINTDPGYEVSIKDIRLFSASYKGAPESLSLQRSFLTYSTKLHHLVQLSTTEKISGVESVDFVTEIKADTVENLIVKDKDGHKNTVEGVDWSSVEYVGFDIKGAGVFGYILPFDGSGGTINVTLADGVYTITQSKKPANGELIPSEVKTGNANDFYMGQRIYNDENHDFDAFIYEAECERNPLTDENITVDTEYDKSTFAGYDPLRGFYKFTLSGAQFNQAYYAHPNRQYRVNFTVTGDNKNRTMYFMTYSNATGGLECAVLLGKGDILLPVPIEVCKNFGSDGDNNIFDIDDFIYSETYFPMVVNAGENVEYSIVNLYQNWGIFPLKQISSIEYHTPFYHLSTGVTETNCIVPYTEAGPGLPDHRAMSAPFWPMQPQHTSGGSHTFLRYTDANGKYAITNNTTAAIDSYGPTYADITLGYVTSDNKIEASYHYMEMPQTDENRTYLELSYKFVEDVSIANFKDDFIFYACSDNNSTGIYQKIGYLDENNNSKVVHNNLNNIKSKYYILGDQCPYFTMFDMDDYAPDSLIAYGYVNISFMIYSHEIIVNGEKVDANFIIRNYNNYIYLSLNLEEVNFKAGDTITINALMMPWGSHELEGSYETHLDKNVREVRENTLLNPPKAIAQKDCEIVESVYLPKVRTTNGQSAEFTLSGGENNVAVRVYGFEHLTNPQLEELVNGKWVPYKVMSMSNRDVQGYGYYYDGYMVHYDEDGTYSYSFIATMDGGKERTFRITAPEEYREWPKVEYGGAGDINTDDDPINVYISAEEINGMTTDLMGKVSSIELADDASYIRLYAKNGVTETFLTVFKADHPAYANLESTGNYVVLKYRLPKDAPSKLSGFEFFANTDSPTPLGPDNFDYYSMVYDDEWHVVILDASKMLATKYFAEQDGKYFAQFLRFDFLQGAGLSNDMYIDIAYIGMSDSLEDLYALNNDMPFVSLVAGTDGETKINPKTGAEVGYEDELTSPFNVHLSAKRLQNSCSTMKDLFTDIQLAEDNSYLRLYAKSTAPEAYVTVFSATNVIYEDLESTGQYVVFKYRLPTGVAEKHKALEIFASTETSVPQGPDNTDYYMMDDDGEWHVVVMDMSKLMPTYCKEADGSYKLKFMRFDFFGAGYSNDYYIDIAYIAICDNLDEIYEYNSDMSEVLLVEKTLADSNEQTAIDPATKQPIS